MNCLNTGDGSFNTGEQDGNKLTVEPPPGLRAEGRSPLQKKLRLLRPGDDHHGSHHQTGQLDSIYDFDQCVIDERQVLPSLSGMRERVSGRTSPSMTMTITDIQSEHQHLHNAKDRRISDHSSGHSRTGNSEVSSSSTSNDANISNVCRCVDIEGDNTAPIDIVKSAIVTPTQTESKNDSIVSGTGCEKFRDEKTKPIDLVKPATIRPTQTESESDSTLSGSVDIKNEKSAPIDTVKSVIITLTKTESENDRVSECMAIGDEKTTPIDTVKSVRITATETESPENHVKPDARNKLELEIRVSEDCPSRANICESRSVKDSSGDNANVAIVVEYMNEERVPSDNVHASVVPEMSDSHRNCDIDAASHSIHMSDEHRENAVLESQVGLSSKANSDVNMPSDSDICEHVQGNVRTLNGCDDSTDEKSQNLSNGFENEIQNIAPLLNAAVDTEATFTDDTIKSEEDSESPVDLKGSIITQEEERTDVSALTPCVAMVPDAHPISEGNTGVKRTVVYVYSEKYRELCDTMLRVPQRASMVHLLIEAYGLLKYLSIIPPAEIKREEILAFHTEEYVQLLERLNNQEEEDYDDEANSHGIGYDCPAQVGVYDYAVAVSGATITAAQALMNGDCHVAINWFGGWHHAKRDEASGFCYLNDIVLGILILREKYQRVLYIDLDLHHGDGVEEAFSATSKVFTLSFHKYSTGFFPGTGSAEDTGIGKGKYFSLNVPLLDGIKDEEFFALFSRVAGKALELYCPEAVVCQCGADGLVGDPMDSFNLTHLGLGRCVYTLLQWKLPLLLLGGGGYNHANTARCWTFLTSLAVGKKLPPDVPDHAFFTEYGPSYELGVTAGNRQNLNTKQYLNDVYREAIGLLHRMSKSLP